MSNNPPNLPPTNIDNVEKQIDAVLAVFGSRMQASDTATGMTTAEKFKEAKAQLLDIVTAARIDEIDKAMSALLMCRSEHWDVAYKELHDRIATLTTKARKEQT